MSLEQKLKRKQKQLTSSGILKPNGQKQRKQEKGKETSTPRYTTVTHFDILPQSSGFCAKKARDILDEVASTEEQSKDSVQKYIDYMNEELKPNMPIYSSMAELVFLDKDGNVMDRMLMGPENNFSIRLKERLKDIGTAFAITALEGVLKAEVEQKTFNRLVKELQEKQEEEAREYERKRRGPYRDFIDAIQSSYDFREFEMMTREKPKPDPFKRKRWER